MRCSTLGALGDKTCGMCEVELTEKMWLDKEVYAACLDEWNLHAVCKECYDKQHIKAEDLDQMKEDIEQAFK
jgi:hypothetical protein